MAALTGPRAARYTTIKSAQFPLGAGLKAYQGGRAYADSSANCVKPGVSGNANLNPIGIFPQTVDNSAGTGTLLCQVDLDKEILIQWLDNATGSNAVTLASNLFQDVYCLDDHTVTTSSSGNSKAGRVWAVDSVKGVGVQSYWPY